MLALRNGPVSYAAQALAVASVVVPRIEAENPYGVRSIGHFKWQIPLKRVKPEEPPTLLHKVSGLIKSGIVAKPQWWDAVVRFPPRAPIAYPKPPVVIDKLEQRVA